MIPESAILTSDMPEARGLAIRLALLSSHYRKPLNWTDKLLADAERSLQRMHRALAKAYPDHRIPPEDATQPDPKVLAALCDDMNTPVAIARLLELSKAVNRGDAGAAKALAGSMRLLGLLRSEEGLSPA